MTLRIITSMALIILISMTLSQAYMAIAQDTATDEVFFLPDKNGFITTWLVCGPFPNPSKGERHTDCEGYVKDYLTQHGGEEGIQPAEGVRHSLGDQQFEWTLHIAPNDYINFLSLFEPNTNVVAYASCNVISPESQEVLLKVGSDDAIHVYDLAYYRDKLYVSFDAATEEIMHGGEGDVYTKVMVSPDDGDTWQEGYTYSKPGQWITYMTVFKDALYANVDYDLLRYDGSTWEKLELSQSPLFAYCFLPMGDKLYICSYPDSFLFDGVRLVEPHSRGYQVRDAIWFRDMYARCMVHSSFDSGSHHGPGSVSCPRIPVEIRSYLDTRGKGERPDYRGYYVAPGPHQVYIASFPSNTVAASLAAYHGRIYVGTHNEGKVYVTAAKSGGSLTSVPKKLGAFKGARLYWNAITPPRTSIKFQIRTAETEEAIEDKEFVGSDGTNESFYQVSGRTLNPVHNGDKWIQYRVFLSTTDPSKTPYLLDFFL